MKYKLTAVMASTVGAGPSRKIKTYEKSKKWNAPYKCLTGWPRTFGVRHDGGESVIIL